MKKLLLFTFALFLWTGAWADDPVNLALNKTVTQIYTPSSPNPESLPTLSNVTDGDNSTNAMLQINSTAGTDIAALCIDLTEANASTRIGLISVIQDGRHATSTAPDTYASKSDLTTAAESWTLLVNCTNDDNGGGDNTIYTKTYSTPNNLGFRYIIFVPTANAYGVSLRELVVNDYVEQILTAVQLPHYIFPTGLGRGDNINATPIDQFGFEYEGDITLSWVDNKVPVGTQITGKNIVFGAAGGVGIYELKADDNNSHTPTHKLGFIQDAATTPSEAESDMGKIFENSLEGIGITNPGWNWKYDNYDLFNFGGSNNAIRVHNAGTFGIQTSLSPLDYNYLKASIYVVEDVQLKLIMEDTNLGDQIINLTGGIWNDISIDIPANITATGNNRYIQFYFGSNNDGRSRDVLIDNVYFLKEATPFDPSSVTSITVTAASTSIAEGKTTQLTVKDQADNTIEAENITFESSNTSVATVDENGLVTAVAKGSATITATVEGNAKVFKTVVITVTEAPLGFDLTEGNHTIHVTPYHYVGTNNYKLVITSEETMTGMGGSFWFVDGAAQDMRKNEGTSHFNKSEDGKTITISVESTSAPQLDNNIYILYPGEVNFGKHTFPWINAQEVNISSYKWASFSSSNALDFGKVEGLTAYIATDNNGKELEYNTVNKVPASTGLLLNGDEGTYDVPVIDSAPALVSETATVISAEDAATGKYYAFGRIGENVGFVKMAATGYTVSAGKSYLLLTAALAAKGFDFIDLPGSETDGINKVNTLVETGVRYNLAGQRVGNDYKGIVVVNGKKYLRK